MSNSRAGPMGLSKSFVVVGAGLICVGVGSLGLLAITSRSLPEEQFARFGVWFGFVNLIAFGLFSPLETALSRAMLACGGITKLMWRQTARYVIGVVVVLLTLCLLLRATILTRLMDDSWGLVVITFGYVGALAAQAIQRGISVGRSVYWPLFWQFSSDGALRLLLPAGIASLGASSLMTLSASVVVSASVGLLGGGLALARSRSGKAPTGQTSLVGLNGRSLAALVFAALGAQLLMNGAPPVLSLADRDGPATLAGVVGALALTRIPLLFASAIQAPLLPPMVHFIKVGDALGLWSLVRRLLLGLTGIFVLAGLGGWYLGRFVLRVYLGSDYGVGPLSMALLASAGVALLGVLTVQAAIVAVGANQTLVASWVIGTLTFLGVMAIHGSGLIIAPLAITLGTVTTLVSMLVGLRWSLAATRSDRFRVETC